MAALGSKVDFRTVVQASTATSKITALGGYQPLHKCQARPQNLRGNKPLKEGQHCVHIPQEQANESQMTIAEGMTMAGVKPTTYPPTHGVGPRG